MRTTVAEKILNQKDTYILLYSRKIKGTYHVIWKKKLKNGVKSATFKEKTWLIDYDKVLYRKGRENFLMIDLDGDQLTDPGGSAVMSGAGADVVLRQKLGTQIVNGLQGSLAFQLLPIIIGLAVGIPIGILLGPTIMQYVVPTG